MNGLPKSSPHESYFDCKVGWCSGKSHYKNELRGKGGNSPWLSPCGVLDTGIHFFNPHNDSVTVTLISPNFRRANRDAQSLSALSLVSSLIIAKSKNKAPISDHKNPVLCIIPAN